MLLALKDTYWDDVNKNSMSYPVLTGNHQCDVLIVGGGISGCLACYYLSLYNVKTILVEKDLVAHADTLYNSALLLPDTGDNFTELLSSIGEERTARLSLICRKAIDEVAILLRYLHKDCNFHRMECIHLSGDINYTEKLKLEYSQKQKLQLSSQPCNSDSYGFSAVYSNECAVLDPIKLCHTLLKAALSHGAKVYEHSSVNNFGGNDNSVTANFNTGKIKCRNVILSTVYKNSILTKHISTKQRASISFVARPLETNIKIKNKCFIINEEDFKTTIRPLEDNKIMINMSAKNENVIPSEEMVNKKLKSLLGENVLEYSWSNQLTTTEFGIPVIERSMGYENFYLNLPFSSNKIISSMIGAEILKDMILYGSYPDADLFKS